MVVESIAPQTSGGRLLANGLRAMDGHSPAAGCVSIPVSELTAVLDWLSPAATR